MGYPIESTAYFLFYYTKVLHIKSKRDSVSIKEPDTPALPTGLVRPANGRYYHRRRVPEDLLKANGKKEHLKSLLTSDYWVALERFHITDAKLQSEWRKARQRKAEFFASRHLEARVILNELTEKDISMIADHFEAAALAGDERRREDGNYDISEIDDYQRAYSEVLPELKAAVALGDIEVLGPMLRQFLDLYRYEERLSERDFRRLAIAFGRAGIRTNEKLLQRYEGEEVRACPNFCV